ncbi:hypothetical protein X975_06540, partial [Stegodyphus mimosarum]
MTSCCCHLKPTSVRKGIGIGMGNSIISLLLFRNHFRIFFPKVPSENCEESNRHIPKKTKICGRRNSIASKTITCYKFRSRITTCMAPKNEFLNSCIRQTIVAALEASDNWRSNCRGEKVQ